MNREIESRLFGPNPPNTRDRWIPVPARLVLRGKVQLLCMSYNGLYDLRRQGRGQIVAHALDDQQLGAGN